MTRDARHDILFEPVKIGPVTAPNRFYAVPHATGHGWSQPNGSTAIRAMKAEGGWGVVSMQMCEIGRDSDMANHPMDRIWDAGDVAMHARQAAAIHNHGALAAVELAHGGMRARNFSTAVPPIGPSARRILRPEVPLQTREMDLSDIRAFREAHKAAALRAKQAGYDILYVYAAHDLSLLSHFLSTRTNHRTDSYGGRFENRLRLLREVLEDTLEIAAGEVAVALRFSVAEPDTAEGLRHDGEGRDIVEALANLPDLWDVNLSGWPADSQTSRFSDEGFQLPFTDFVKSVTEKPVVGVGRFTSPDTMASVISSGRLDLIGAARPSIADPFLPRKVEEGRYDEIRECIGCNHCVSMDSYGVPIRCTQNPTISEEWQRGWHPELVPSSSVRKSHLIIGAGPAGLECALTLLKAGHRVTIAEAGDAPGGRVRREAGLPGLSAWMRVVDHRMQRINVDPNAELYLGSHMTAEDVRSFDADEIILATGATWRADGVGASYQVAVDFGDLVVWTPDDVMGGAPAPAATGFIVYDDDHSYMASLVAENLARQGHRVAYFSPEPVAAGWTDHTLEHGRIMARLAELRVPVGVNLHHQGGGVFQNMIDGSTTVPDASHLVMVGMRDSDATLYHALLAKSPDTRIHRIGDCYCPSSIHAAVYSGYAMARALIDDSPEPKRERPVLEMGNG